MQPQWTVGGLESTSSFQVIPGNCSSNPQLRQNTSWPIILLILAYQQLLTMPFHLICSPMTVPSSTYHVFNWFTVLTPHQTPTTYLYPISLLTSMYLIGNSSTFISLSRIRSTNYYIQAPPK